MLRRKLNIHYQIDNFWLLWWLISIFFFFLMSEYLTLMPHSNCSNPYCQHESGLQIEHTALVFSISGDMGASTIVGVSIWCSFYPWSGRHLIVVWWAGYAVILASPYCTLSHNMHRGSHSSSDHESCSNLYWSGTGEGHFGPHFSLFNL